MCFFESDNVKNYCPLQENYEIFKDLIQTSLLFVMEILKKKKRPEDEKSAELQSCFSIFVLPTLNLKKKFP